MRNITNIQIDELILHIVDPKPKYGQAGVDRSFFSQRTLPLEENQELVFSIFKSNSSLSNMVTGQLIGIAAQGIGSFLKGGAS